MPTASGAAVPLGSVARFELGQGPTTIDRYDRARRVTLGADLVGIASADVLNAFPPDPRWPQTPERITPYCRSVIVIAQRIPAGAFRCKVNVPVQYMDMLVLRRMDRIALRLAQDGYDLVLHCRSRVAEAEADRKSVV